MNYQEGPRCYYEATELGMFDSASLFVPTDKEESNWFSSGGFLKDTHSQGGMTRRVKLKPREERPGLWEMQGNSQLIRLPNEIGDGKTPLTAIYTRVHLDRIRQGLKERGFKPFIPANSF